MSFGPHRLTSPKNKKANSPPRSSAEVAENFSSNIRKFDPTRRRSPKDFLRRKLPVSISPTKRRQGDNEDQNQTQMFFAFPSQRISPPPQKNMNSGLKHPLADL